MAFAILDDLVDRQEIQLNYETAEKNYVKAICKGLFKIMSKMGISTIRSYRGAKLFEAIGLSRDLADTYFGGTKMCIRDRSNSRGQGSGFAHLDSSGSRTDCHSRYGYGAIRFISVITTRYSPKHNGHR